MNFCEKLKRLSEKAAFLMDNILGFINFME